MVTCSLAEYSKETDTPVHGGLTASELRRLGLSFNEVTDFSVNSNPLGPPPQALKALEALDISAYPDPDSMELKEALSCATRVPLSQIVIGNGTTEIIHLLAHTFTGMNNSVAILTPTFGEYQAAAKRSGAGIISFPASRRDGFTWDLDAVCSGIRRRNPDLVFLCNPNNPTGVYLPREAVDALLQSLGNGLLVLDESYVAFTDKPWEAARLVKQANLVILHSMTKEYAMAGLRLGYAICPEPVALTIRANQPSWSVNAAAQVVGLAALSDQDHLARSRICIRESKAFLMRKLQALGYSVLPSAANFVLVAVRNATLLRSLLLTKGVCVRDCTSFGLPDYIRIGVKTIPECDRLLRAMEQVVLCNPQYRAIQTDGPHSD